MRSIKDRIKELEKKSSYSEELIIQEVFHGFYVKASQKHFDELGAFILDGIENGGSSLPIVEDCSEEAKERDAMLDLLEDRFFLEMEETNPDFYKKVMNHQISAQKAKYLVMDMFNDKLRNTPDNPLVIE